MVTVDLHAHILPGVDDGADNMNEAFELLGIAALNGTTDIVLTPHYLTKDLRSFGVPKQELISRFENFRAVAAEKQPGVNLYLGSETFGVTNIAECIDADMMIPINGTRFILTEFGFDDSMLRALDVIDAVNDADYTVILAHPERYRFINQNPDNIIPFLDMGVLLQLNSQSITGQLGRAVQDTALSFIDSGVASVVGSDCHSPGFRSSDLSEAFAYVASVFSPSYADALFNINPREILKGNTI